MHAHTEYKIKNTFSRFALVQVLTFMHKERIIQEKMLKPNPSYSSDFAPMEVSFRSLQKALMGKSLFN